MASTKPAPIAVVECKLPDGTMLPIAAKAAGNQAKLAAKLKTARSDVSISFGFEAKRDAQIDRYIATEIAACKLAGVPTNDAGGKSIGAKFRSAFRLAACGGDEDLRGKLTSRVTSRRGTKSNGGKGTPRSGKAKTFPKVTAENVVTAAKAFVMFFDDGGMETEAGREAMDVLADGLAEMLIDNVSLDGKTVGAIEAEAAAEAEAAIERAKTAAKTKLTAPKPAPKRGKKTA